MSVDETFFPSTKTNIEEKIHEIGSLVSQYEDGIVVSHAFSNGGAMLMQSVLKYTDAKFAASVFDSAPSSWISPVRFLYLVKKKKRSLFAHPRIRS